MRLTASQIAYIITIRRLSVGQGFVRAVDIAWTMGVSKPSVTQATHRLREEKILIRCGGCGFCLTEYGKFVAERCEVTVGQMKAGMKMSVINVPEDEMFRAACAAAAALLDV